MEQSSTNEQSSKHNGSASEHGGSASEHREGKVARAIEEQTAKLPSDLFLWAALATIAASFVFQVAGTRRGPLDMFKRSRAPYPTFIGLWAPTLLLLGLYNKIVKVAGSDRASP